MPDEDPGDGEDLDPRVEGALGELNSATDDINTNEKLLEETKGSFKTAMDKIQVDLRSLANKCGRKTIEKARPYHEALFQARKAHYEARQAAVDYDKGGEAQQRSKAMVTKFETELAKCGTFNESLQLQLNKATQAVMEADAMMRRCSKIHGIKTQAFLQADQELMGLAKSRRKVILKSQPYFACKERHDRALLGIKREIQRHEAGVADSKARVAAALKLLETISTEIHESRQAKKKEQEQQQGESEEKKESKLAEPRPSELEQKIAEAQAETARREKEEAERKAQEEAEKEKAAASDDKEILLTDLPESETAHVIEEAEADISGGSPQPDAAEGEAPIPDVAALVITDDNTNPATLAAGSTELAQDGAEAANEDAVPVFAETLEPAPNTDVAATNDATTCAADGDATAKVEAVAPAGDATPDAEANTEAAPIDAAPAADANMERITREATVEAVADAEGISRDNTLEAEANTEATAIVAAPEMDASTDNATEGAAEVTAPASNKAPDADANAESAATNDGSTVESAATTTVA